MLRFGKVNVNSIMNKMDCLTIFAEEHALDIVDMQERWLTSEVSSSFVTLNRFSIVRGDTEGLVRKHGVCMYVRKESRFIECFFDGPNAAAVHLLDFDI